MHGIVICSTGSWYTVRLEDGRAVDCKVKGSFRLKGIRSTNPVAVGDRVKVRTDNEEVSFITEIEDRRNYIIRKASNLSKQSHILAANIDQVFLIATLRQPETSTTFIDRLIASAEAYRVPVTLIFNKTDILDESGMERLHYLETVYSSIGYTTHSISSLDTEQVLALRKELVGQCTLLTGHSGVGKSTFLNVLVPSACAKTAEVSEAHETGMHTTTFSRLYELPDGGSLIDIPGIKGFGTFDIDPHEVASYFRDIFNMGAGCRFNNCTHTHEPGCAVLQALEEHQLAPSRYASYLSMLEDKDETKYRQAY